MTALDSNLPDSAISFEEWISIGIKEGWCGPPVCSTHDGIPTTEAEDEEFEMSDPCVHIIRLYEDADVKAGVEANHFPSKWRDHYTKGISQ